MGKIVCEPCGATVEGDMFITHSCPKSHDCLSDPRVVELKVAADDAYNLLQHPKEVPFTESEVRDRLRTALEKMK